MYKKVLLLLFLLITSVVFVRVRAEETIRVEGRVFDGTRGVEGLEVYPAGWSEYSTQTNPRGKFTWDFPESFHNKKIKILILKNNQLIWYDYAYIKKNMDPIEIVIESTIKRSGVITEKTKNGSIVPIKDAEVFIKEKIGEKETETPCGITDSEGRYILTFRSMDEGKQVLLCIKKKGFEETTKHITINKDPIQLEEISLAKTDVDKSYEHPKQNQKKRGKSWVVRISPTRHVADFGDPDYTKGKSLKLPPGRYKVEAKDGGWSAWPDDKYAYANGQKPWTWLLEIVVSPSEAGTPIFLGDSGWWKYDSQEEALEINKGKSREFILETEGVVYFLVRDDTPADNRGSLTVEVAQINSAEPTGRITYPPSDSQVARRFRLEGTISGQYQHLWLIERIGRLHWPKEPELKPEGGRWIGEVNEGGWPPEGRFEILLVDVSNEVNMMFQEWLKNGHRTGHYPGIPTDDLGDANILDSKEYQLKLITE